MGTRTEGSTGELMRKQGQAREAVKRAIYAGALVRPLKCQQCGVSHSYIQGHHSDYSEALNVMWLCPRCHFRIHGEERRLRMKASNNVDIELERQKCRKCGHSWWPRSLELPKRCPRCQADDWRRVEQLKEARGN